MKLIPSFNVKDANTMRKFNGLWEKMYVVDWGSLFGITVIGAR